MLQPIDVKQRREHAPVSLYCIRLRISHMYNFMEVKSFVASLGTTLRLCPSSRMGMGALGFRRTACNAQGGSEWCKETWCYVSIAGTHQTFKCVVKAYNIRSLC